VKSSQIRLHSDSFRAASLY